MRDWLALAAVLPLVAATGAQAQMQGLAPGAIAEVATTRALDLRLAQEIGAERPLPLVRGMIVGHELAPNALLGLGLATFYSSKKRSSDMRLGERINRSSRPAVTFVLKF
jgi:hypothetical protein